MTTVFVLEKDIVQGKIFVNVGVLLIMVTSVKMYSTPVGGCV